MTQAPTPERWNWRESQTIKHLFWPAVWLGVFLLAYAGWRLYWKVQVQSEQALVRAAGHPADLQALDAWYKKPEGRNAAEVWPAAHAAWVEDPALEDWMPSLATQPDSAAGLYSDQEKLGLEYPDEVTDKIRAYWAKNAAAWPLMREAAAIDGCRWKVDLTGGFETSLPHLGEQRQMSHYLDERMRLAGKEGDWTAFAEMADVGFKQANDTGETPLLISGLVKIGMNTTLIRAAMRELPFLPPDAKRLETLQGSLTLQRKQASHGMARDFRGEAACVLGTHDFARMLNASAGSNREKAGILLWSALGGADHDRCKLARHERGFAELESLPESRWLDDAEKNSTAWKSSQHGWEVGCKQFGGLGESVVKNHLQGLMAFDTAITALAAERHRIDHGKLPATLNDLVPAYLPAVPGDAFDHGKPLQYKVEADRFTVYSVGKNKLDDGGDDKSDIRFTILLPNAPRGVVPKRKDLP